MAGIETNIFPIINLSEISAQYRLYQIKGLRPEQDEYYSNRQHIINKISRQLRNPVTIIERDDTPFLVVRDDAKSGPPERMMLTRTQVVFVQLMETFQLDFAARVPIYDHVCLRFLDFSIKGELYRNNRLWQPSTIGATFFEKNGRRNGAIIRYPGFSVKTVITHDGGIGLCVDVTSKTISSKPLPDQITRDEFEEHKGRHCVYRFGHQWYEIKLKSLHDFNISEFIFSIGKNQQITLIQYVKERTSPPYPPEIANLSPDASTVMYFAPNGQERAAVAPLCFPVLGTHNQPSGSSHAGTILDAHRREHSIRRVVQSYLKKLSYGNVHLHIKSDPVDIPSKKFVVPDLRFGKDTILSVKGTTGAQQTGMDQLGKVKLSLLSDMDAGFYETDPLLKQHLILPESVCKSWGISFLADLKREVRKHFAVKPLYDPEIITFDDSGPRTYAHQGKAIRDMLERHSFTPGYAVIMTHYTSDRGLRDEHQLDAMAIRELRQKSIFAAVIHSEVGQQCYRLITDTGGKHQYVIDKRHRGKMRGYLRIVTLNKVLLANQRWPFVLAEPLKADVTIGIDVKENSAGIFIVGRFGSQINFDIHESRQKEKLLEDQLKKYLEDIIEEEAGSSPALIRNIVIHRDGRLFSTEIKGALSALENLKRTGIIASDALLTLVEIPKRSSIRLRLFDFYYKRNGRRWIENPEVGHYYVMNDNEAFLCSTGRPYLRNGTANPLFIRKLDGGLSIEDIIEDIYKLSTLTWTKPDDCLRYPITIKLNDRYLIEDATDFDEDEIEFYDEATDNE